MSPLVVVTPESLQGEGIVVKPQVEVTWESPQEVGTGEIPQEVGKAAIPQAGEISVTGQARGRSVILQVGGT